jgi:hypothetical protein
MPLSSRKYDGESWIRIILFYYWDSPTPLPQASLTGWGSPNSDDWRKGLALRLLCGLSEIREKYIKKGIKGTWQRGGFSGVFAEIGSA